MSGAERKCAVDAVIITGQARSGKTALALHVSQWGYFVIRASAVVAEMVAPGQRPTRRLLLEIGSQFESASQQIAFGERLLEHAAGHREVVFDGVRLPGAVEKIRAAFTCAKLVYVQTSESIRRQRFAETDDGTMTFDEVNCHGVEQSVLPLKEAADLILDGSSPIESNLRKLSLLMDCHPAKLD